MFSLITKGIFAVMLFSILSFTAIAASSAANTVMSAQHSVNPSPYLVLKTTGSKLFSRISANQQAIQRFPHLMRDIVEEELMPAIDYRYASYRVLGKHLKKISKQQRAEFVEAMRHYLVRSYSVALANYTNQQVIFESDKPTKGSRIIGIKTQIIEQNAPTINVVFKMRANKKTGQWKAFDIVIEGISLLSTKQAELNRKITQQGINHVILELAALA